MKPQLVQLLALLGITDVASEEAALTTATQRLDSVRTFLNTLTPETVRLDDVAALQRTLDKMKATADQEGETAKEELLARLKTAEDALAEVSGERDVLKTAADKAKADQAKKTDAEERKRLDSFVTDGKLEIVRADSMDLPTYRRAIVVAASGPLPEGLPDESVDAYVRGSLSAAVAARVDALGGDRADPWKSFNFDDPSKKRRTDSKPKDDPEAKDETTPTEQWSQNADAAFEAAKGAN